MARQSAWLCGLIAATVIGFVVARPWLDPRFSIVVDDGQTHLLRQYVFAHLLGQGVIYPRWWPDLLYGFGYPVLGYYSPGIYYAGALAQLFGAGAYQALQVVGLAAVVLGASGAYVLGWVLFRRSLAALVVAGAYVLAPYPFITNLYLRAAVPEAVGLGLLPWVLAGGIAAVRGGSPNPTDQLAHSSTSNSSAAWRAWEPSPAILLLALPLASVIVFHSLSGIVALGLLAVWLPAAVLDVPCGRRRAALRALSGVALGLMLASFVWLPAAAERGAVHGELGSIGNLSPLRWLFDPLRPTENPVDSAVPEPYLLTRGAPLDLHWIYPHAGSGLSGPAKPSLAQGVFLAGALLAAGAGWLSLRSERGTSPVFFRRSPRAVILVAAAALPVLWVLNVSWSTSLWKLLPMLPLLQFPWRLWGPFSLFLACAGAALFVWLARRGQQQWVLAAFLVGFLGINGLSGLRFAGRFAPRPMAVQLPSSGEALRTSESDRLASGTTSGGEFLPQSVVYEAPLDITRGGRGAYETTFPEAGWVAGKVWPYRGAISVDQVWATPTWTEARVNVAGVAGVGDAVVAPRMTVGTRPPAGDATGDAAGAVAFRTLVFPGWRAFVDGRPAPLSAAPFDTRIHLGQGFAIVPVPSGEHTVRLQFGPTPSRTLAGEITILAGGLVIVLLSSTALRGPPPRCWSLTSSLPPASSARHIVFTAIAAITVATGLAYAAAGWRTATRPTGRAGAERALVVLNLVDAVDHGAALVSSPSGAALGQFVDIRHEVLGGQDRRWLYVHPPSEVRFELTVPPHAVFQAGLGLDPQGWDDPSADGVRFVLEASGLPGGAVETLLDQVVQPQVNATDRGWRFAQVDLGRFAGRTIRLRLRTDGRDTPYFDWAGWADPMVYVDTSARYPPPAAVAPAMLPRLP